MIAWDELWQLRREAMWEALVLLGRSFVEAASAQPWMWVVAGLVAITLTRRAWWRLIRFVGLAAARGADRG